MGARVKETGLPLVYVHWTGGQDELVFDGASFVLNADRSVGAQLPTFRDAVALTEWRRETGGWRWMWATFAYMLVLAYIAAFATYHVAVALGAG